jgi:hypothetical protein
MLRTTAVAKSGLDAEFDKFTVWPEAEQAKAA